MEPDASPPPPPTAAVELRALGRLRERIEAAAREVERLRDDNAALAERLAELQEAPEPGPVPSAGDDPEQLRARIAGFIGTIDRLLDGDVPAWNGDAETSVEDGLPDAFADEPEPP